MDTKVPISSQHGRPSFLGTTPLTPLAMETTQRVLQQIQNRQKPSCLKCFCFVLLLITGFNTLFMSMIMYKNSILLEENRILLGRLFLMESNHNRLLGLMTPSKLSHYYSDDVERYSADTYKLAKLVDIRPMPLDECPPCTTPKPTPVEPHKNPVSILNEEIGSGKAINYECIHTCINPPIHLSFLSINNTELQGKQWEGQGMSKSEAKQVAAFKAIKEIFPHLESSIGEDYIPDMEYHPKCKTPNPEGHVDHEGAKKC